MDDNKQKINEYFSGNFTPFYEKQLGELKRSGKEVKAKCPFHDDHHPSLNINPVNGLCSCKPCGFGGDIFKFYAKRNGLDGDFPATLRAIIDEYRIPTNGTNSGKPGKLVKRYAYQGPDGTALFYKNRFEPKSFSISRPDGNGGFLGGMNGIEPVLYNLPAVAKADEVFIVEGEKDADNLNGLGFTATTNFDGAGKWREAYSQALKGKHVVLIPDADDPGRAHMQMVAAALRGVAASVKVLELPNPNGQKGYDVSDFISEQPDSDTAGERLSIMAEGAEHYPPITPDEEKPRFEFIHNADILTHLKPIEWRIRDILPEASFYYDFGESGHYKTFVALDRLLCIAAGLPYHGHPVKQGPAFYICGEGQQGIGRRVAAWHITHHTRAGDVPFFVAKTPTQLMDPNALDDVKRAVDAMAKAYGDPALVHLDTLARNFGAGDENATADMNQVISNLDMYFGHIGRGLSHHTGHMNKDRARGNYALHAASDAAYRVRITSDVRVLVECKKMKDVSEALPMLFSRETILLQIQDTEDQSCILKLLAEGNEALELAKEHTENTEKASGNMDKALRILDGLYCEYEANLKASGRIGTSPRVTVKHWREKCLDDKVYGQAKTFNKAIDRMKERKLIQLDGNGMYAVTSSMYPKYFEDDEF